ncbi:MAG: hypothetical protein B1H08_01285 [Candidatus Omnitrophica bacterium 4484_171]|nr:MAG: hypothetical protein B1H08_01285 [Candidatus Omnitrophica bacterium 4484_171]
MNIPEDYSLRFPEVVIVEASAGTGKTRELAKRYLQLILSASGKNQVQLNNILATTFTNKAAFEMKDRILDFLKKIALGFISDNEKDILAIIESDKEDIGGKAAGIMDIIIRNYSFFQIQTIDSLMNSFLLSSALNIGLSAEFKIKKDQNQYLRYCFDKIVEDTEKDPELFKIFEEFLKHYIFVENRSSWFPKQDILDLMKFLFSLRNKYGAGFYITKFSNEDILKQKAVLYKKIKEISSCFPDGLNKSAAKSISKFIDTQDIHFEIKTIPGIFKDNNLPMNKGKNAPESFARKWKSIVSNVTKLVDLESQVAFKPYIKLFIRVLGELKRVSRRDDIIFLEELNSKTNDLISSALSLPELYYRMSMRFSHYLIDEFQDTSILQWSNLKEMIEDALSSGGTLFCVGDKKQEIYRFRGGETKLFNYIRKEWRRYNVKNRILKKNWRSHKAIVEFNNKVFSADNLRNALSKISIFNNNDVDTSSVFEIFSDSRQEYKEENKFGYVYKEFIEAANQEERNKIVSSRMIELIASLKKRCFEYKNIAVLCRSNDEIELVTSWLLKEGIPVESEKTLDLKENPLIKEMISFLRFLNSPIDDISFVSFISGDIFSAATGLAKKSVIDFIFDLHKNDKLNKNVHFYRLFRKKYPEIWNTYIDKFFKSVGFLSPYELVVSIYDVFNVADNFEDEHSFFMKLLELIKAKEQDYAGLDSFLYYLEIAPKEDLYVTVTKASSVRLLTIHKSKGLEFDIVIIPFMYIKLKPEEGMNSFPKLNKDNNSLELLRITKEHRKYSKTLNAIYNKAYVKSLADELNAMYVAFTRAKLELYMFIPEKSGASFNNARHFLRDLPDKWGTEHYYKIEERREKIRQLSLHHKQDWIDFLKDEILANPPGEDRNKLLEGEIMHFALSCIENLHKNDEESVINNALAKARTRYPFFEDFGKINDKLYDIIGSNKAKRFFYIDSGNIYTEKDIVDYQGRNCRIDRLVVFAKEAWVIDYKSSRRLKDEHITQIKGYIRAVKDIYPDKEVKGFLFYINDIEAEEI